MHFREACKMTTAKFKRTIILGIENRYSP